MKFLENDLEEIIYTSGIDVLDKRGLYIEGELRRQVKIGNYGIADLISIIKPSWCHDRNQQLELQRGYITIYELKKEQIGIASFLQVISYAKGVLEYLKYRKKDHLFTVSVVLIGRTIDTSGSFCFLPDVCRINNYANENDGYISFYTYDYKIDGLYFTQCDNYDLKHKGFNKK